MPARSRQDEKGHGHANDAGTGAGAPPAVVPAPSPEESRLVEALRRGDEAAFAALLERYHMPMIRLAMMYVSSRAEAEDVVQETWLGIVRNIQRFEMRSSLRTWMFRILVNRAKTQGQRGARTIPFSALALDQDRDEPAVEPFRFKNADDPREPHHWVQFPSDWGESPEERLLAGETRAYIERAVAALPRSQREVISLRDIQGWTADEVCEALGISDANQRVLLHRARSKVRRALETYMTRS